MSNDELLKMLAERARHEARQDDPDGRWQAFCEGRLSAEEVAELRQAAQSSEELAAAFEAYRPLDETFRDDMLATLRAQLGADSTGTRTDAGSREGGSGGFGEWLARARRAILEPRGMSWALPAGAAAAAVLSVLLWPVTQLSPLPDYGLVVRGGIQELRGEVPAGILEEIRLADGNRLSLLLTPRTTVSDTLDAKLLLLHEGELSATTGPPVQISDAGAVLIEGVVGVDVSLPRGRSMLLIAVGHEDALPADTELAAALASATQVQKQHWQAWKIAVRFD